MVFNGHEHGTKRFREHVFNQISVSNLLYSKKYRVYQLLTMRITRVGSLNLSVASIEKKIVGEMLLFFHF